MRELHMKSVRVVCLVLMALSAVLPVDNAAHAAAPNLKYAGLVVEADTGNVLYADQANARRYPASLTKLMTLYMTFSALREGRVSDRTPLTTSQKAASMSPTKINLRPGERISVRDAMMALIVHSANDAAAVLAEGLGGSEWAFGQMMTQKARQLGMHSTSFRNASGLPDSGQYTTARDMAVLAMALRRHFPEYYPLFKQNQFSYKGRTYFSHNRVTQRLPGAEGLKTGYINASGFNLVTTVNRGGKTLVGVVMGGRTAASRDAHMISLLERSYAQMGRGEPKYYAANTVVTPPAMAPKSAFSQAPVPKSKPTIVVAAATPAQAPAPAKEVEVASNGGFPTHRAAYVPFARQGQFKPAVAMEESRDWGIQVGAYNRAPEAVMAAITAAKLANNELYGAKVMVSDVQDTSGERVHRARLANIDETQARRACQKLMSMRHSCFVVRMGQQESL